MNGAHDFVLVPDPPGFSFTTPTVQLSRHHFLTVYCSGSPPAVKGIFWHIENQLRDESGLSFIHNPTDSLPKQSDTRAEADTSKNGQEQGPVVSPADHRPVAGQPPLKTPLTINGTRQLFIDDHIIESLDGVVKNLNQPVKYRGNPVLPMEPMETESWDADMPLSFSSVLFDEQEQVFKMWYSLHTRGQGDAASLLCYATSEDGIRWQKPELGIYEFRGTKQNNIVMDHSGLASGVFRDQHEADPDKRYKMLHMWRDYKVYASYSADGRRWHACNNGEPVLFVPPGHDSHMIGYRDERLNKYVAIVRDRRGRIDKVRKGLVNDAEARQVWRRLWDPERNREPQNHTIRRVAQAVSSDFVHWTDYRDVLGADADDPLNQDQFYNMEVMSYQDLRIGLMTVFSYDPDYCRGAVQLTYSRDGRNWHRAGNRKVFLPLSERRGDFDWGSIYPLQAPVVVDDEILVYFTGCGLDHLHQPLPEVNGFPSGIGLAKLRLDGFVSVDAGTSQGTLTTRPFVFEGCELVVNADARSGQVSVEILGADGRPVDGFSKSDCDLMHSDRIRQTVTWNGRSDLSHLSGSPVRLKFYLKTAKLFSFMFPARDSGSVQ